LANAAIAASRVGASPRNGASAAVFVVLAYRRGGSLYDADTARRRRAQPLTPPPLIGTT